jgi:hypothetical protein
MNQRDRDNLEFLLNASPEVIEDWYNQMDDDDIEYAFELLDQLKEDLDAKIYALDVANNPFVLPETTTVH